MTAAPPRRIGRLLVTGARGFVGGHVQALAAAGGFGNAQVLPAPESLDVRDAGAVAALVGELRPDSVLHLAAQSFVPRSFEDPRETFEVNVLGTVNLLQALVSQRFTGRLLYVSSGDVYGQVPEQVMPVTEDRAPEPRNPYAASKVAAEQACLAWHRATGLDCIVARPFNHIGPGQGARFVLPALARQAVAIAGGRQAPVIEAGDIDVTRDFCDVRDVVAAYAAILSRGRPGAVYHVASGVERRLRDVLGQICQDLGISAEIRVDPARLRSSEQRRMVASSARLQQDTGWAPQVPFQETIQSIIEEARRTP